MSAPDHTLTDAEVTEVLAANWWAEESGETERWEDLDADEREAVIENSYAETHAAEVVRLLAARLATAEAEKEALRAERLTGAVARVTPCACSAQRARAEAAEAALAGLVADLKADAARMANAGGGIYTPDFIAGVQYAARIAEAKS